MKKKAIISLIFFMAFFVSRGQNLVPNYSFEDLDSCIHHSNEFNGYVSNWTGQAGVSGLCYFTSQCPKDTSWPSGGVPYNYYYGFQYAHTGVSYAGILTFVNEGFDTVKPYTNNNLKNVRNYIEARLIDSLRKGHLYYVTFYVNLQNPSIYACSDIGAYFSNVSLSFNSSGLVLSYIPQITNDPKKQELTDTLNWMKISGSFIAKGGEQYITIGNFKSDTASSIRYLGQVTPDGSQAWYYIDDVIVSPDSNYADSIAGINQLGIRNYELKVWPNPSKGVFNFQSSNQPELVHEYTLEVYNMFGEKVYSSQFSGTTSQFSINLNNKQEGIYLYRVVTDKGEAVGSGKLIIE